VKCVIRRRAEYGRIKAIIQDFKISRSQGQLIEDLEGLLLGLGDFGLLQMPLERNLRLRVLLVECFLGLLVLP